MSGVKGVAPHGRGWVVDTCVLIDILVNDPEFGRPSAMCLKRHLSDGLVISPISMIELSPAFAGDLRLQQEFLRLCGVAYNVNFRSEDVELAHEAWNLYVQERRLKRVPKRPVADLMIGAFSSRFEGLITRNQGDFEPWLSGLKLVVPP